MSLISKKIEPGRGIRLHRDRESGAALVLVLWFTLVISLIAAAVAGTGQSDARIAINLVQAAKAEALADGGLQMALAALARRETNDPWPIDGTPREVQLEDAVIRIEIRDEGEKLNLNTAGQEDLATLFLALGRTPDEARSMAEVVILRRGTELVEVARADLGGQRAPLRSGRFLILGDIQGVAGVSNAEYRILRNLLSLYSPPNTRRLGQTANRRGSPVGSGRQALVQPRSRSRTYGITVRVEHVSGAVAEVYAVVRGAGNQPSGFQILHWE
ncbi:MAG: general secretion pathway protein GspK [Proteobacteria bacterium]|nr:general secretion pathway protein GspK [Pseudomonadota bacterium]